MDNELPHMRSSGSRKVGLPLLLALVLLAGIGIGLILRGNQPGKLSVFQPASYDRLQEILNYINSRYVDSVDTENLFQESVNHLFKMLDPHSLYISAAELSAMNEPLQGHFEGIGIEFYVVEDTITVVTALPGGPSERVGLQAGDKIVKVEDSVVAGVGIQNEDVVKQLKGPGGSTVKVSVLRYGNPDLLDFTITRDAVPIASIDAAYMLTPDIGYIKMTRFAYTTYEEMVQAIAMLKKEGMTKLLLDLRDNGGGYLDQATRIADEFLSGNKKIVYTEGRMYPEKVYRAGKPGIFEEGELVVMINENAASASEILAGALQDWERATIVGRRSFGKALVQEEIMLQDGSALRLTVARYFTPKGRSIQRPYEGGVDAYNEDHWNRIVEEYEQSDSFAVHDTSHYGIQPDVYIPWDTSYVYRSVISMINRGFVPRFVYKYYANHTDQFSGYSSVSDFLATFRMDDDLFDAFITYSRPRAAEDGWAIFEEDSVHQFRPLVAEALKAYFGRQLFYQEAYFPVMNRMDREVEQAVSVLQRGTIARSE